MRKLYLLVASCVALVAFMGFSATALANHVFDSDCAADPDAFEVTKFTIGTPDSKVEHKVSGIVGTGLTCGSRIHGLGLGDFQGVETLNDLAIIQNPPGVENNAAPSADLPKGSYVGEAQVDALTWIFVVGGALPVSDSVLTLRVDDRDDPITPPGGTWGSPDCPADAITCYRGKSDTGHGWTWVEDNPGGSTTLTIGRFYNDVTGEPAGLTEIDNFSLCGYAGDVGGISCGDGSDSSKWLQKNGDDSVFQRPPVPTNGHNEYPDNISIYCRGGLGMYTVTVKNRAGATTDPATSCVRWRRSSSAIYRDHRQPIGIDEGDN